MNIRRVCASALLLVLTSAASPRAQPVRFDDLLSRLFAYTDGYGERLRSTVAEERYRQQIDDQTGVSAARMLVSDYALLTLADRASWTGFRDTFLVDGQPVREREDRLLRLIEDGSPGSLAQAARIAEENARFNIGNERVRRNVNIPTLVIELLHRHRSRFAFHEGAGSTDSGTVQVRVDYREKQTPTIIRRPSGENQPVRGSIWVAAATGAILRTSLTWEKGPRGSITVTYGSVPRIDVLVPLQMTERYVAGKTTITGDATYVNYRRFETDARIVTPAP